jgi:stage II sporulation protein GA (sporulation sigma-E factor processing peptidase)
MEMTVVYIDLLFLLNGVANYLLLLAGGRMSGAVLRRGYIALAAAAGAGYAAALFLPGLEWLAAWPCKLASGVLMAVIAYGTGRQLMRGTVMFFGAAAALAGLVLGAQLLGSGPLTLENGVLYSRFDLRLLLLLFVLCYFILSLFFRRLGRHDVGELVGLEVRLLGKTVHLRALRDTGNTLTDPADDRPVVVVEYAALKPYLPVEADPDRPVDSVRQLSKIGVKGSRLLSYRAVGTEMGMLLALRAEAVTVEGRPLGALLVALSPGPVSDGGGYQALIGGI